MMPPTFTLGLLLNRRDVLISASALSASFALSLGTARAAGPATHDTPEGEHTMGFVTTDDDVQIFYKDWGPKDASPSFFTRAGRSAPTTGTRRCFFCCRRAIVSSRMTGEATDVRSRSPTVTTLTTTRQTRLPSPRRWTCGTRFTSAIPPVAAKWPVMWPRSANLRTEWSRPSSSPPFRR
ncbi:exported hypothetical protein [Mesorhizobium escarrei]|uniref:Uncharacterized protein n=1 Tax=Mesorhizobium escarrei TaxID=666018 RepID=A0ABN8K2M0_9HYPH|nr:exported hypothetical protein [Mesorhizobium escarrei]